MGILARLGRLLGMSPTDGDLRAQIKAREASGLTGATDATLHALNVAQTNRMSDDEIRSTIASRKAAGKPTAKLEAAARDRCIYLSDAQLRSAIKAGEAHGLTGATNAAQHARNVAQTNRMSGASITSTIAARKAAGKPTAKLEAAARQRGIRY